MLPFLSREYVVDALWDSKMAMPHLGPSVLFPPLTCLCVNHPAALLSEFCRELPWNLSPSLVAPD